MGNRVCRITAVAALMMAAGLASGQVFSSSPNAPIFDLQTTRDTINVAGGPASITNMAVTLNILHTWTADLDIVLVFNGQTLELSTDNGGSGDNYQGTRFIDSAAQSITVGLAPFTGDFRPEGGVPLWSGDPVPGVWLPNFAAFNGQNSNGPWELFVYDDTGADTGTLQNWSIDFNPGAPPPPPPGPPNDFCADATPVGEGTHAFNNNLANTEYSAIGCPIGYGDIFYSYTPSFTGTANIFTCAQTSLDTTLTAYDGCAGAQLACNDDACGLQSRIQVPVTAGVPVIIRIASFSTTTRGSGTFTIEQFIAVGNDQCADAIPVGEGIHAFDNTTATTDYSAVGCPVGNGDVWFLYTPTFTGTARVTTCGLTTLDTTLTALEGCYFNQLACNDDACGLQSRIEFPVTAGSPVRIRVASWSTVTRGSGSFLIEEVAPAPNDLCQDATAIGEGAFSFDNSGAGTEVASICGFAGDPGGSDIFFRYTASFTGLVEINTCGSALDSQIDVATDCSFSTVLACNDDSCGLQSRVIMDVTAGTDYFIRVAGWAGATGSGILNIFQIFPGPQPNDLCQNATPVADGVYSFDTVGALPGGPGACGASGGSPDIFYLWTPSTTGCATIETCGSGYDTVLEIVSACGGVSLACNDDACGLQSRIEIASVTAGVPILVRVSGFAGASGFGQVSFLSQPASPYTPPSGTPEAEPCGNNPDTINAGCNSTPPSYLPINCGETILGTSFVIPNALRDTDWFQFTLDEFDTVNVVGQARFGAQVYILDVVDCSTGAISIVASAFNSACSPDFALSTSLPPGTWYVFISSANFTNIAECGTGTDEYWMTMTFGNGCGGGGGCDPDFNQDGNVDQDDIACLAQVVAGDPSCSDSDPDFNGDGNVDQDDIDALSQVVGGAPCP